MATKTEKTEKIRRSHGLLTFSGATETDEGVTVPALSFVEGTHVDAAGIKRTYSQASIRKFAKNSNAWLESGEEIPLFESPHDAAPGGYSNKDKIGLVTGKFSARTITQEMLPKPEFSDLVGKLGLYAEVQITRPDAIANYHRKLIKPISVGLGSFGKGPQVYEISAVPFGAVRGAMLFSHPMTSVLGDLDLDEDLAEVSEQEDSGTPERQTFALTLEGAIAERENHNHVGSFEIERLTDTFRSVIRSIKGTTEAELQGRDRQTLMAQAVNDLGERLRKYLGITTLPPVTAGGTFAKSTENSSEETMPDENTTDGSAAAVESSEDSTQFNARFAALEQKTESAISRAEAAEAKVALYERNQATGDRYLRLRQRASALNTQGRFSRAAFLEYFPEGEQLSDAVARFSRLRGEAEGEEAEEQASLDDFEAALNYAEKFGRTVATGSISGNDPLPSHPVNSAQQAEEEEDMARFNARRGVKQ